MEVNRWVETGKAEEAQSRVLVEHAFYETIDFWIQYFADNQEVVDLVTSQSVSFAEEVVEEVRERTVSADNLLEGLLRYAMKRTPREELSEPPAHIRRQAVSPRQLKKGAPKP